MRLDGRWVGLAWGGIEERISKALCVVHSTEVYQELCIVLVYQLPDAFHQQ